MTAAVAGILAMGSVNAVAEDKAPGGKFKCDGGNKCKGQSECHTAKTKCKGENACGGQGWVSTADAAECDKLKAEVAKSKKKS